MAGDVVGLDGVLLAEDSEEKLFGLEMERNAG